MKLYLPDRTSAARFHWMRQACREAGFIPLTPADNAFPEGLTGRELAAWIKEANRRLIDAADAVVANITPFSSPSMDPRTARELATPRPRGCGGGLPVSSF